VHFNENAGSKNSKRFHKIETLVQIQLFLVDCATKYPVPSNYIIADKFYTSVPQVEEFLKKETYNCGTLI
jgi:hypothetical protein